MTEDALKTRSEYYREWRKKNPDKVRASQERYWLRKAEQIRAREMATEPEQRSVRVAE